ncbi:MAG TPA: GTP cyclohydrolase II [Spirochaetia bacterium]|nr:GTP cyclohydrolase II [Spirochaetia bacterium]
MADADTDRARTREALEAKLKGKPDFVREECYCKGVGEYCIDNAFCVQLAARATLPTRFGTFTLYGFYDNREGKEHTAIVNGDVEGGERVPLRVHSECHTGDVWGSLRCDCREQLEAATRYIAEQPCGVVIYLKQEGRGIGLLNKIRAYQLQELGLDTIEANQYLDLPVDARDYKVAAKIIKLLKIRSVMLLTNNPDKIQQLQNAKIHVAGRIPIVIPANRHDKGYLDVKKEKMGHLM